MGGIKAWKGMENSWPTVNRPPLIQFGTWSTSTCISCVSVWGCGSCVRCRAPSSLPAFVMSFAVIVLVGFLQLHDCLKR